MDDKAGATKSDKFKAIQGMILVRIATHLQQRGDGQHDQNADRLRSLHPTKLSLMRHSLLGNAHMGDISHLKLGVLRCKQNWHHDGDLAGRHDQFPVP